MELEATEYVRKSFTVVAYEVTYKNIEALAELCKGKIDVETSRVLGGAGDVQLPVIKLQGQGEDKGKELVARLGYFIVVSKGRYRVYKAPQFHAAFEQVVTREQDIAQYRLDEIEDEARAEQEKEDALYKAGQLDNSSVDGQETVHVRL